MKKLVETSPATGTIQVTFCLDESERRKLAALVINTLKHVPRSGEIEAMVADPLFPLAYACEVGLGHPEIQGQLADMMHLGLFDGAFPRNATTKLRAL